MGLLTATKSCPLQRLEKRSGIVAAPAWRRRTNVWRKGTRPARGPKLPISDRQRGAISCAANRRDPVAGSALPVVHRPLAARSRAEAEHELATIPTCIFFSACLQVSRRSLANTSFSDGNGETPSEERGGTKGMMYGLAALTVGVSSIPLLFILWRALKAPIHLHSRWR